MFRPGSDLPTPSQKPFVPSEVEGHSPSEAEAFGAFGSRLRSNRSLDFARDERNWGSEGGQGATLPFAALAAGGGFISDPRFAAPLTQPQDHEPGDPLTQAWEDGYSVGLAEAEAAARTDANADAAARERIELALARLDGELAEALRQKLFATVKALCEAAIAPLALDAEALSARVARAAEMLARADDDKRLRLHPDDLVLVAGRLPEGLAVEPDPALERGALRFETSAGGIEDGPAHWRRAIAEAIAGC